MLMNRNDVIIIAAILVVTSYLIFKGNQQADMQGYIEENGSYCIAVISNEHAGKSSMRSFYYNFQINKKNYKFEKFVSVDFYNNNQIGDTILIKFLPNEPEKSIIIEDKEYKHCYGLPPKEGWLELPKCE